MLRSAANFGGREFSRSLATIFLDEHRTIQSGKDDADINVIVRRFGISGGLPVVSMPPPITEFMDVFDFQSAMNVVVKAQKSFGELDADVRARFNNDPARFVEFVEARDANGVRVNLAELRKFKLALPEERVVESPPMRVEVVNGKSDGGNA